MRIVDRARFLALPRGTVYSHYRPMVDDGLYVKGSTQGNDWYLDTLTPLGAIDADSSDQLSDWTDEMQKNRMLEANQFQQHGPRRVLRREGAVPRL